MVIPIGFDPPINDVNVFDVPTNPSIDSTVYDCGGSGNIFVVIPVCPGLQVKAIPARVIGSPALNGEVLLCLW